MAGAISGQVGADSAIVADTAVPGDRRCLVCGGSLLGVHRAALTHPGRCRVERDRQLSRERGRQHPRRQARRSGPRAVTLSVRAPLTHVAEADNLGDVERPRTRGDCVGGERPCPFVGCRHNLYLDVNPESGSIKFNFPDIEVWKIKETCSLDVADRGGITLEEVGNITNLTRERIRQVEVIALHRLRSRGGRL